MEGESTNGKLKGTKKEELHEEEKEVVIEGVEKLKRDNVDELLRDNVVDENSVDVKGTVKDGEDTSSSSSGSDEENLEDKNEGFDDIVIKSGEPLVPLSEELFPDVEVIVENIDVTELESKEIKEQILPSLDESNELSAAVTDMVLKDAGQTIMSVKLASKENEDSAELQLDENDINPLGLVDLESKENVNNSLQMSANVPSVDTDKMDERNIEVETTEDESMINQPPIISLASRARQMTSWRSCCGLFDVLRRSDR